MSIGRLSAATEITGDGWIPTGGREGLKTESWPSLLVFVAGELQKKRQLKDCLFGARGGRLRPKSRACGTVGLDTPACGRASNPRILHTSPDKNKKDIQWMSFLLVREEGLEARESVLACRPSPSSSGVWAGDWPTLRRRRPEKVKMKVF